MGVCVLRVVAVQHRAVGQGLGAAVGRPCSAPRTGYPAVRRALQVVEERVRDGWAGRLGYRHVVDVPAVGDPGGAADQPEADPDVGAAGVLGQVDPLLHKLGGRSGHEVDAFPRRPAVNGHLDVPEVHVLLERVALPEHQLRHLGPGQGDGQLE